MRVMLDYRFEIPEILARIKIRELKRFNEESEKHFKIEFEELKAEVDHLTPEEWSEGEDHYIGLSDALDSLRELKTHFAIVGLFAVFETFLRDTLKQLLGAGVCIPNLKSEKCWTINEMKRMFAKAHVPITKPQRDWNGIKNLQAIRNCITHLDGLPNEEIIKKLKGEKYDVIEGVPVQLPAGYFEENANLIQRHCNRIIKDCQQAFTNKIVKS